MKIHSSTILVVLLSFYLGCGNTAQNNPEIAENKRASSDLQKKDYRHEMRDFVIAISEYAKKRDSSFAIIPQNGIELVTDTGYGNGKPMTVYLNAIDGNGQEELFFGYKNDNKPTPKKVTEYLSSLLKVSQSHGNSIFTIDYCTSEKRIAKSYKGNYQFGFIPFVATERNLTIIPSVPDELDKKSGLDITKLSEANNFLFFLNYEEFKTKNAVLNAISKTNYDVVFLDLFFSDGTPFTSEEIKKLKTKANGGKRLVCSYMSIGEAEDYRYYWKKEWKSQKPSWLENENENWPGNYKVNYWNKDWQSIIFGNANGYLDKILNSGFDGVYMDIIDAFEYFENQ